VQTLNEIALNGQRINEPVIHVAENDAKHHVTHAEDDRDFHLERVEKRDLVGRQLPGLTRQPHTHTLLLLLLLYTHQLTVQTYNFSKLLESNKAIIDTRLGPQSNAAPLWSVLVFATVSNPAEYTTLSAYDWKLYGNVMSSMDSTGTSS